MSRVRSRGFTLVEVVIALAILSVSLGVLLTSQAASLNNAARSRDLTIATLLARSKMIDLERQLFDEGFVDGEQEESGDFRDEGHEKITWAATISELDMDLSSLTSLCAMMAGDSDDGGGLCESTLSSIGGVFDGFMNDFSRSVRLVELTVTWPVGGKFEDSMQVKALVTRDDFTFLPASAAPTQSSGAAASGGASRQQQLNQAQ